MANPTLLTMAQMAYGAYSRLVSGTPLTQGNYGGQAWNMLGTHGGDNEGFIGCAFVANDESHTVVVYAGTDPWSLADYKANLNIKLLRIPRQIESAKAIFDRAREMRRGSIYVVGHSLGGALAQIVGTLKQAQFVTFNAPGMRRNLENQGIVYKDSWRVAKGVNYRLRNDWVGTIGEHLGQKEVLDHWGTVTSVLEAHTMAAVIDFLRKFHGYGDLTPLPLP